MTESKLDGHYCVIQKDGPIKVLSRHNKPLAVSPAMLESLSRIGLSDGDELHGEWTSRRESNKNEGIYLFNWTFSKYEWLGSAFEEERHKKLYDLKMVENISIVEARTTGYAEHYKSTINNPSLEGIVLKLRKAKIIGDSRSPKDNPGYFKLKYRTGCAGDTLAIVPDHELITRSI